MTTATSAITWAAYGAKLRTRLRTQPSEDALLESWLALAVEDADRYISRDFTVPAAAPTWVDGLGYDDGWTPLWGYEAVEAGADAALPLAIWEGCVAFVRAMRAGELQDVGLQSAGSGMANETRTAQTANSVYLRALGAARPFWDSVIRNPLNKGGAL